MLSSDWSLPLRECEKEEAFDRTSEAILRKRGRRMAIEAAIIPVPGSAVAHIVALMLVATDCHVSLCPYLPS
jgi:hypothetical protein